MGTIGQRLVALRRARNMIQTQAANVSGVSRAVWAGLETGHDTTTLAKLEAMAGALGAELLLKAEDVDAAADGLTGVLVDEGGVEAERVTSMEVFRHLSVSGTVLERRIGPRPAVERLPVLGGPRWFASRVTARLPPSSGLREGDAIVWDPDAPLRPGALVLLRLGPGIRLQVGRLQRMPPDGAAQSLLVPAVFPVAERVDGQLRDDVWVVHAVARGIWTPEP